MEEDFQYSDVKNSFQQYYQEKILPQLTLWETKRKKYLLIFILIVCIVLFWVITLLINFKGEISQILNTWGCLICFAILAICFPLLMYYQQSKESILPLIINFFGHFSYQYRPQMPIDILKQSKIIKADEYLTGDDSFYGQYCSVKVNIIEYIAQKCISGLENKSKDTIKPKKSYGIMFIADMNKRFNGQTIVVRDRGILNKFTHYQNLERVSLEDPLFEKAFETYGDDQIEARYILTTPMIEQMLQLKSFFPEISFSFFAGQVLINIKTKKNYFECSNIFRSHLNKRLITQTYSQMNALFSIIHILQLDQNKIL